MAASTIKVGSVCVCVFVPWLVCYGVCVCVCVCVCSMACLLWCAPVNKVAWCLQVGSSLGNIILITNL